MATVVLILLIILTIGGLFSTVYYFRKAKQLNDELYERVQQVTILTEQSEKEVIPENASKKLEDKNRKLFQMSEAVYREKKKVDEENESLRLEKEKLELEKKKVDEKIKKLWQQSTAIHKEKEKIEKIKAIIEQKHKDVTESITYAKRIQTAILPLKSEIHSALPSSFVLFMPRDIVSGDFYWFSQKEDKTIIAAVDCTGHGVPGAFMSMVGHTLLNEIIDQKGLTDPGKILNELDNSVRFVLKQDNDETSTRDGMDICLCVIEHGNGIVHYAGASRPLWIIRNSQDPEQAYHLEEIKATKAAIGGIREEDVTFLAHTIKLEQGDTLYLTTDGYADQFSSSDKKLMTRKFKELLLSVQEESMEEQMNFLQTFINEWKVETEQTDDILVIGVKLQSS